MRSSMPGCWVRIAHPRPVSRLTSVAVKTAGVAAPRIFIACEHKSRSETKSAGRGFRRLGGRLGVSGRRLYGTVFLELSKPTFAVPIVVIA